MDKYIDVLNEAFRQQFIHRFAIFAETTGTKGHALDTFKRSINSLIEDYRAALRVLEAIHEQDEKVKNATKAVGGNQVPSTPEMALSQSQTAE